MGEGYDAHPPRRHPAAAPSKCGGGVPLLIYAAVTMTYLRGMPGLSTSELAIVLFLLLLVIVAGRLPRWGEALGSYLYKRGNSGHSEGPPPPDGPPSRPPPEGTAPPNRVPPPPS